MAGCYELKEFTTGHVSYLWNILLGRYQPVPPWIAKERLEYCRRCQIFYPPLQTCGTPLTRRNRLFTGRPMGCMCFMPVKAKTECNCWLAEEGLSLMTTEEFLAFKGGWPKHLNSDTPEEHGEN